MKKRNFAKTEMLVPIIVALAVLLVITGIIQPWFSVRTSPELQLITNSTISIDVNLFQTVTATRTDGNVTNTLTFTLSNDTAYNSNVFETITGTRTDASTITSSEVNVTDNLNTTVAFTVTDIGAYRGQITQEDENRTIIANSTGVFTTTTNRPFNDNATINLNQRTELTSTLGITTILTAAGLAISILALALFLIMEKTSMERERYAYLLGMAGALLLFMAPLFMALNVTSFWGSTNVSGFLWVGTAIATWGPSTGWYLTFAASLILFACSLIIRASYLDKKRVLAMQSLK
jgi:hypothetical protein